MREAANCNLVDCGLFFCLLQRKKEQFSTCFHVTRSCDSSQLPFLCVVY